MASSGDAGEEGIIERKMVFCPRLRDLNPDLLIKTCQKCECFFLYCCHCSQKVPPVPGKPCHHFPLVFTDGACRRNGQNAAISGIGWAGGTAEALQFAVPIDDDIDEGQTRTSQRAELLAAIHGVHFMATVDQLNDPPAEDAVKLTTHGPRDSQKEWVIATDSERKISVPPAIRSPQI